MTLVEALTKRAREIRAGDCDRDLLMDAAEAIREARDALVSVDHAHQQHVRQKIDAICWGCSRGLRSTESFEDALAMWRKYGGSLILQQATSTEPNAWRVIGGDYHVAMYADAGCDDPAAAARAEVVAALGAGGLSDAEIAVEMRDWQD